MQILYVVLFVASLVLLISNWQTHADSSMHADLARRCGARPRDPTEHGREVQLRADGRPTGTAQLASAIEPSYILSSIDEYFFSTTLRLTLRLGVSSPSSTERSFGRIANCLTVSYFASVLLT